MLQEAKKERITLDLRCELLDALDRLREDGHGSRSDVVERVLEDWYEQRLRDRMSVQMAEYYQSMTDEEREEDEALAKASTEAARKIWTEEV